MFYLCVLGDKVKKLIFLLFFLAVPLYAAHIKVIIIHILSPITHDVTYVCTAPSLTLEKYGY